MKSIWILSEVHQEYQDFIGTPDGLHQEGWGGITYRISPRRISQNTECKFLHCFSHRWSPVQNLIRWMANLSGPGSMSKRASTAISDIDFSLILPPELCQHNWGHEEQDDCPGEPVAGPSNYNGRMGSGSSDQCVPGLWSGSDWKGLNLYFVLWWGVCISLRVNDNAP